MFERRVSRGLAFNSAFRIARGVSKHNRNGSDEFDLNGFGRSVRLCGAGTMTEPVYEDLSRRPRPREQGNQTDAMLYAPPELLKQALSSDQCSAATQIDAEDGLLDFDAVVESAVIALTNMVLEQSRMEVMEEREIARMEVQQQFFERGKFRLEAQVIRLEKQEQRCERECGRRVEQFSASNFLLIRAHCKITARICAKQFVNYRFKATAQSLSAENEWFQSPLDPARAVIVRLKAQTVSAVIRREKAGQFARLFLNEAKARLKAVREAAQDFFTTAQEEKAQDSIANEPANRVLPLDADLRAELEDQLLQRAFRCGQGAKVSSSGIDREDCCMMGLSPLSLLLAFHREQPNAAEFLAAFLVKLAEKQILLCLDLPEDSEFSSSDEVYRALEEKNGAANSLAALLLQALSAPESPDELSFVEDLLNAAAELSLSKSLRPLLFSQGSQVSSSLVPILAAPETLGEAEEKSRFLILQSAELWAVRAGPALPPGLFFSNNAAWLALRLQESVSENKVAQNLAERLLEVYFADLTGWGLSTELRLEFSQP